MKKHIWILTLLIGMLILSACAGEEEIDSIEPINNAAWPTPLPPEYAATGLL